MDTRQRRAGRARTLAVATLALLALVAALPALATLPAHARVNVAYLRLNRGLAAADAAAVQRAAGSLTAETGTPDESRRAWRGLGVAALLAGDADAAAAAWQNVPGGAAELMLWGEQAAALGDWATARQRYELAVRLEPQNGDAWYALAWAAAQTGAADAFDLYGRALAAGQHARYGRSNILTRRGELARNAAAPDWAAALAEFEAALRQDEFVAGEVDDRVQAELGRAEALDKLGQAAAALDAYRQTLTVAPGHYWANVHSGRLTWAVEHDAARAAAYLQEAITLDPESKWAYLFLSDIYAESGQPELAIPLLNRVLAAEPADEAAQKRLDRLTGGDGS